MANRKKKPTLRNEVLAAVPMSWLDPLLTGPSAVISNKKSSADGKRSGFPLVIFGGEHADVPINEHAGAHVAELVATGNRSCLIDLGGWMIGARTRFFIDYASTLFKLTKGRRYQVIDECHNFAPKGKIFDPDAGKALHWANRLASEGQGKGLVLLAASQRPQKVHNDFLTSCETLIACRVIHKADRDAIKDWIDGCADAAAGKQVLAELAQMQRTDAWVWSPEIDFGPKRITFPMFSTYDSFKPQEAGDPTKLTGWADVDLEDVKAKLQSVVEEAKANDPAELKKRIRELEKQVAARLAPGVSEADAQQRYAQGHRDGFNEGATHGYQQGWNEHRKAMLDALEAIPAKPPVLGDIPAPKTVRLPAITDAATAGKVADKQWQERRAEENSSRVKTPVLNREKSSNGVQLSKAERLCLTALAQYPQGRTKSQVAILSGYAVNGGGFNNALSSLRSKGFIEGTPDRMRATDDGVAALGDFEPLPQGDDLLRHWLGQLSKAERAALEALAKAYPQSLSKEDLAEAAGYEPSGGGFNNALSRLRTLELITGRGELRASEDLF